MQDFTAAEIQTGETSIFMRFRIGRADPVAAWFPADAPDVARRRAAAGARLYCHMPRSAQLRTKRLPGFIRCGATGLTTSADMPSRADISSRKPRLRQPPTPCAGFSQPRIEIKGSSDGTIARQMLY